MVMESSLYNSREVPCGSVGFRRVLDGSYTDLPTQKTGMHTWVRQLGFLYLYFEFLFYQHRPRRVLWHHPGLFLVLGRLMATLNHQLLIRWANLQYLGSGLYSTGRVDQKQIVVVVGGLTWPNTCILFVSNLLGYVRRVVDPEATVLLYLPPESVYGRLPTRSPRTRAIVYYRDQLLERLVQSGIIRSAEESRTLHLFGHSYGSVLVHGLRKRFPTVDPLVQTEFWEPVAFRSQVACRERLRAGTVPIHPIVAPLSRITSLRQNLLLYLLHYGPFADTGSAIFAESIDTSDLQKNVRVYVGSEDQLQCLLQHPSSEIPDSVVVLPGGWHGEFLFRMSALGGHDDSTHRGTIRTRGPAGPKLSEVLTDARKPRLPFRLLRTLLNCMELAIHTPRTYLIESKMSGFILSGRTKPDV